MSNAPVLHSPAELTTAWLEAALERRVLKFEQLDVSSSWGAHARLVVHLEGAPTPWRLRVKIGSAAVFGRAEVDYYLRDFQGLSDAPLVRCHHAAADETHYHLLLDDLHETHRNQDDVPVTEAYGHGLARSLAALHAFRWGGPAPGEAALGARLAEPRAGLPVLVSAMAERFSAADVDEVQRVYDWLPGALAQRAADARGYAWVHGDLNPGNILAPRVGTGTVLLLDHQPFGGLASRALALEDLAHAMVLWWPEADTQRWAPQVVAHWHSALAARGVRDYPLERARADWGLCVAAMLLVPAARCSEPDALTTQRALWELFVRRWLAAVRSGGALLSRLLTPPGSA